MSLRPTSLRTRLALWYGFAVGAAILLYAGGVLAFFRASLFEQLERRLHYDYEAAEHAFELASDGALRWTQEPHDPDVVSAEAPWAEVARPGGPALLRRPGSSDPAVGPFRTREYRHRVGSDEFVIRVGRSERGVRHELGALILILALGLVPAVAMAFLGGLVLARRALAPVGAMTERARTITAERLAGRLPVENPRDELGQLATVFNDLIARLERSFDQLRRFTADASHELRTPLTAMRTVGEVGLGERRDEAGYREVVGSMLEEVDRLTRLVDGLLALARGDAGRVKLDRKATDLLGLAREVASHLAVLAEEKGQTLEVVGEGSVPADVDAVVLRQAVTNLVDNAVKYGPEDSRVTISVGKRDGIVSIAVSDQGPGVPAEHRNDVFERFYRVDPARPRGGVGLGLPIARAAIEAHGGTLALGPAAGGSTFIIAIPTGSGPA